MKGYWVLIGDYNGLYIASLLQYSEKDMSGRGRQSVFYQPVAGPFEKREEASAFATNLNDTVYA